MSECMGSKAVLAHNVKAYRGTGGVAPCLLKLDIIFDSLTHRCFMARKEAHGKETALAPRASLDFEEEEKSLALARIRIPDGPAHCLVTILTTLTQTYCVRFSVLFNNDTHSRRLYFKLHFKDNSCF